MGVDLKADGSEAFLLTFSSVSVPGLWRGIYKFRVNGVEDDLLHDLASHDGSGAIRIPHFSKAEQFVANQISLGGTSIPSRSEFRRDSSSFVERHSGFQ